MFPFLPIIHWIPTNNMKPPTLYAILNSKLNYENENPIKIKDLAENGTSFIFDFDYPLSSKVDKQSFEKMLLNHFLMRRLGYDTYTAWHIALEVKMNEIMPYYNTVLDSIIGWDLFNDGESVTRTQDNTKESESSSNATNNSTVNITDNNTQDLRYSNMPQDRLTDIQNGSYVTEYNYNKSNGSSNTTTENTQNDKINSNDIEKITENIVRTPADKMTLIKQFMTETKSVYSLIFQDLDSLFYQLD